MKAFRVTCAGGYVDHPSSLSVTHIQVTEIDSIRPPSLSASPSSACYSNDWKKIQDLPRRSMEARNRIQKQQSRWGVTGCVSQGIWRQWRRSTKGREPMDENVNSLHCLHFQRTIRKREKKSNMLLWLCIDMQQSVMRINRTIQEKKKNQGSVPIREGGAKMTRIFETLRWINWRLFG